MFPAKVTEAAFARTGIGVCGACILLMALALWRAGEHKRAIESQYVRIGELQEQVVSAQITASRLDEVQKIIQENLAYSRGDTLTQGASLTFLRALTEVLDKLEITLLSLNPEEPADQGRFVETPYRMEIRCTYAQFCKLVNKMEQSSRLISLKEFEIENYLEDYYNQRYGGAGVSSISMTISTLTLVRGGA
jgi:Tfp pilus assembly protein PilO